MLIIIETLDDRYVSKTREVKLQFVLFYSYYYFLIIPKLKKIDKNLLN